MRARTPFRSVTGPTSRLRATARTLVAPAGLGLFGIFGLVACDAIIGIEDLQSSPRDPDPQVQCQVPTDCPAAGNSCFLRSCEGGVCKVSEAPPGTQVLSQIDGDCKVVACNAEGIPEEQEDPTDVSPDGNECTDDLCVGGEPVNQLKAAGTPCSTGVCHASGACVQCLNQSNCQGQVCQNNLCVPASCQDNIQNNGETDKDCGGPCAPCGHGKICLQPDDCISGVCENSGGPNMTCQAPSCDDGVHNGQETDIDCGGPGGCLRCEDTRKCVEGSDCQSLVCACSMPGCNQPTCQAPTCSDGVQNGGEVAIDCQGNCEGTCDVDEPCVDNGDCGSNLCGGMPKVCHDCNDGFLNGTELQIDCGGGVCPPCG